MKMKPREYKGKDIVVRWDKDTCIHAAECVKGLGAVFNTEQKPWVLPDAAPADLVEEVVARCPSGALSCERVEPDGGQQQA